MTEWTAGQVSHHVWRVTDPKGKDYFVAPADDADDAIAKAQGNGNGEYQVASRKEDLTINPREAAIEKAIRASGGGPAYEGLPVHGYAPQPADKIAVVNKNKELEEVLLRVTDTMRKEAEFDQRWISIAVTHFQEGFMALNRAVFKPGRIELASDYPADTAKTVSADDPDLDR